MKSFTVKRSKWARGGMNGDSALLNDDGCRCCLGFAICQITKLPMASLKNNFVPEQVFSRYSFLTKMHIDGYSVNNDLATKAMKINDNRKLTEQAREKQLAKLFRKHKIIIKFVD